MKYNNSRYDTKQLIAVVMAMALLCAIPINADVDWFDENAVSPTYIENETESDKLNPDMTETDNTPGIEVKPNTDAEIPSNDNVSSDGEITITNPSEDVAKDEDVVGEITPDIGEGADGEQTNTPPETLEHLGDTEEIVGEPTITEETTKIEEPTIEYVLPDFGLGVYFMDGNRLVWYCTDFTNNSFMTEVWFNEYSINLDRVSAMFGYSEVYSLDDMDKGQSHTIHELTVNLDTFERSVYFSLV